MRTRSGTSRPISTFTENGVADAHRMASGHPGYTQESTEELFERKEREKDIKASAGRLARQLAEVDLSTVRAARTSLRASRRLISRTPKITSTGNLSNCVLANPPREPITGGTYTSAAALKILDPHYCIGVTDQDVAIYRIGADQSLSFVKREDFELHIANMRVSIDGTGKSIPAAKFRRESKHIGIKNGSYSSPEAHQIRANTISGVALPLIRVRDGRTTAPPEAYLGGHLPARQSQVQISY